MAIYNGTNRFVIYQNGQRFVDQLTKPKCPNTANTLSITDFKVNAQGTGDYTFTITGDAISSPQYFLVSEYQTSNSVSVSAIGTTFSCTACLPQTTFNLIRKQTGWYDSDLITSSILASSSWNKFGHVEITGGRTLSQGLSAAGKTLNSRWVHIFNYENYPITYSFSCSYYDQNDSLSTSSSSGTIQPGEYAQPFLGLCALSSGTILLGGPYYLSLPAISRLGYDCTYSCASLSETKSVSLMVFKSRPDDDSLGETLSIQITSVSTKNIGYWVKEVTFYNPNNIVVQIMDSGVYGTKDYLGSGCGNLLSTSTGGYPYLVSGNFCNGNTLLAHNSATIRFDLYSETISVCPLYFYYYWKNYVNKSSIVRVDNSSYSVI